MERIPETGIKEKKPFFSVVIPVYNKGVLFSRALGSVLVQTETDYEVIVVDDGSTDNARDVVRKYDSPKVTYVYQAHSGLPAVARNAGIRRACGEYIAFLDADDAWYPEKLGVCRDVILRHPEADVFCHDEALKELSGAFIRRLSYGPYVPEMFRKLLFYGNCLSPSATVVRKEVLTAEGGFRENPEFFSVEDYDLWLRLARRKKFYFIPEMLGEYVVNSLNISADFEKNYNNQAAVVKANFRDMAGKKLRDHLLLRLRLSKIRLLTAREFGRKKRFMKAFVYLCMKSGG